MTDTPTAEIVERLRVTADGDLREIARDMLTMGIKAEPSELRAWADQMEAAASRLEQLEAENKRLREALVPWRLLADHIEKKATELNVTPERIGGGIDSFRIYQHAVDARAAL